MNLFFRSLQLDFEFLSLEMSISKKFEFIFKKYIVLFKNIFFGFKAGKSNLKIYGGKYFYEDKFGIAFLQSVYVDNAFLSNFISRGSVIVDIGGNIGQFNFFCKNFLRAKKVYSFEPVRSTFDILKLNSPENIYHCAISGEKIVSMFIPDTSLMAASIQANESDIKEDVKGVRLDDIESIREEKVIDLLKIDTEGSELEVLKVSKETLKKSKYILVETSVSRKSSGDIMEVFCFLKDLLPNVKLIWVGRPYISEKSTVNAMDVVFYNDFQK